MQNNNYPDLDSKQRELLTKKMEQDEEPIPSEIKIIESEDPSSHPKDIILEPPAGIFVDKQDDHLKSLKNRVKELENEIGSVSIKRSNAANDKTFRDSYGNETFYVKNISGNHIVISDTEGMDKLEKGKVADLLESASLEEIHNSRDIRKLLHNSAGKYLKRLTEQEYFEEREKELMQEKKIRIMSQQELMQTNQQQHPQKELLPHEKSPVSFSQTHSIRPVIKSKLGKLALRFDPNPENSKYAMTGIDFIEWINAEALNHAEIDYILGDPSVSKDFNIRAALLEKKRTVKE